MDTRLAARAAAALVMALAAAVGLAHAQPADPDAPVALVPPPEGPPPVEQPQSGGPAVTPSPPSAPIAPETAPQTPIVRDTVPEVAPAPRAGNVAIAPPPKPEPPPGPPRPVRAPIAILRVLDKVTAETLRFEAPVGKHVRYKTLIFTVKACETRGPDDARPRPSAYVVIESQAGSVPGRPAPPTRELYKGWMFASGPGLHPFEHPVYDAWLDVCAGAPTAPPPPA